MDIKISPLSGAVWLAILHNRRGPVSNSPLLVPFGQQGYSVCANGEIRCDKRLRNEWQRADRHSMQLTSKRIAVLGAGLQGACIALELASRGVRTTL